MLLYFNKIGNVLIFKINRNLDFLNLRNFCYNFVNIMIFLMK